MMTHANPSLNVQRRANDPNDRNGSQWPNREAACINSRRVRGRRRIITREHGIALETLGHAFDYLNDKYAYLGDDEEIVNVRGPHTEALQIFISAHRSLLQSLPMREPFTSWIWSAISRRKRPAEPVGMVTLTSSR